MPLNKFVCVAVAFRELDVVHPVVVLLDAELPLLAVDQELRKVVKFRNDLSYIRHLPRSVVEAVC